MADVGILGATGYTAFELMRILLRHPTANITAVTSRTPGADISEVHPALTDRLDLKLESPEPRELAERCDFVFCALPHGASMAAIPELLAGGTRVIDLSADYRLDDADTYRQWYKLEHTDAARLPTTVYGLPELFADRIVTADLVANPGCYTSTSILALAPLLSAGLIESTDIIIDAKSGVSGAGRTPKLGTLFAECNESMTAYGIGQHRHMPEIDLVLSNATGQPVEVLFTPHLAPMDRGILATIYASPKAAVDDSRLLQACRDFYAEQPFVRVVDHIPATKHVSGTNYCDLTVRQARGRVVIVAAIDNLLKGAAGVAVQNFNLMSGSDHTSGLIV